MSFWQSLKQTIARNPISFFAVACVAAIGVYLARITNRMLTVLESSAWCAKARQAGEAQSCDEILSQQLGAIADGFRISNAGWVLMMIVLIVVVVAGARA